MQNVLLVIHLIACIALVISVMIQRSEGGALGMGGGGTGGIISGRGAAGVLVRTTMVLAAIFFATSLLMTRLNAEQVRAPTGLERAPEGGQIDFGSTPDATPPVEPTTPPATTAPDPLAPASSAPTVPPATDPAPETTTPPATSAPADPLAPATPTP